MRALIVDDEPVARKVLREELELLPDVEIVGEAEDGVKALTLILTCQPDLVFLDLQMPGKSGFEVIQELRAGPLPTIIIVTAFDEYAVRAFEAGAVDYLLKPISHERLQLTLQRVRQLRGKPRQVAEHMAQLQEIADGVRAIAPTPRRVVGRNGEEFILLNTNEVMAFQADGDLVWILTLKNKLLATQTLRELQIRLGGSNFQRVHRGSLVNVNHVRKMSPLSSQRWLLTLNNGQEIIVSKRQAKTVRELLSR